jgi:hypothetical protein
MKRNILAAALAIVLGMLLSNGLSPNGAAFAQNQQKQSKQAKGQGQNANAQGQQKGGKGNKHGGAANSNAMGAAGGGAGNGNGGGKHGGKNATAGASGPGGTMGTAGSGNGNGNGKHGGKNSSMGSSGPGGTMGTAGGGSSTGGKSTKGGVGSSAGGTSSGPGANPNHNPPPGMNSGNSAGTGKGAGNPAPGTQQVGSPKSTTGNPAPGAQQVGNPQSVHATGGGGYVPPPAPAGGYAPGVGTQYVPPPVGGNYVPGSTTGLPAGVDPSMIQQYLPQGLNPLQPPLQNPTTTQSNQNMDAMAARINQNISLLKQGTHDYGGHRAAAMRSMKDAVDSLGTALQDKGVAGSAVPTSETAPNSGPDLSQAQSDQNIMAVQNDLKGIIGQLQADGGGYGGNRNQAVQSLTTAINELGLALQYRQNPQGQQNPTHQ